MSGQRCLLLPTGNRSLKLLQRNMKLLLDANIPWRLTKKIKTHFEDCFQVDHIGIPVPAKDTEI